MDGFCGGGGGHRGFARMKGWSTWNTLACEFTEKDLRQIADIMVRTGLTKLGYVYLNIDDCWEAGRDNQGRLLYNTTRFPSGIRAWGDYLHSLGMKFGIYTSSGESYIIPHPDNSLAMLIAHHL